MNLLLRLRIVRILDDLPQETDWQGIGSKYITDRVRGCNILAIRFLHVVLSSRLVGFYTPLRRSHDLTPNGNLSTPPNFLPILLQVPYTFSCSVITLLHRIGWVTYTRQVLQVLGNRQHLPQRHQVALFLGVNCCEFGQLHVVASHTYYSAWGFLVLCCIHKKSYIQTVMVPKFPNLEQGRLSAVLSLKQAFDYVLLYIDTCAPILAIFVHVLMCNRVEERRSQSWYTPTNHWYQTV